MARGKSSARARAIGSDSERELQALRRHLEVCYALVVVCVEALQAQNADLDAEIALALKRAVGDRLSEQIEKTAALTARFKQPRP
ncbi:MAG: hypothetical protein ACREVO_08880 [Steroidobacteraceae bacterium]